MKKNNSFLSKRGDWLIITFVFITASSFLYGYFWLFTSSKLQVFYQNWDGPTYTIIAQSLYDPAIIEKIPYAQFQKPQDFASTFPLYSLVIRLFSPIGWFRATILVSLLSALLSIIAFYELVKRQKLTASPLLLSLVFIFLPPRWFISSHIGSSEPLFLLLIILSFFFFYQSRYLASGIFLGLAQLTRSQALFFFAAFVLIFLLKFQKDKGQPLLSRAKKYLVQFVPYLLSPLSLLLLFFYFHLKLGNFWAFNDAIAKWPQIGTFPLQVFTVYPHPLVPTFWIENHFWIYFFDVLALLILVKNRLHPLAVAFGVYFSHLFFLIHVDLARFNIPLTPFLLIAFEKMATNKLFVTTMVILLPALYAYSINFLLFNR